MIAETDKHATTEELLEMLFSVWSTLRLYIENKNRLRQSARVEAGWNNSTVTLQVVGGNGKESLKSETVKYGHESKGTRTRGRLRWQGPAAYTNDRTVLSSKRAPHKNKTITVKQ
jgi:hypothetical protein